MPSPKTALEPKEKKLRCEVLRAIGIDADPKDIEKWKTRADRKGINFKSDGFTTMVYPNKPEFNEKTKSFDAGEPVFIDLDKKIADKLTRVGAVRIDVSSL